ncbi:sensor histidine kinase [Anaerococcus tetradius]|uniref:sensor histidine kinase n=1 Tax=Anaerococcus tetradius TaxID=33036 RepID=UPI0023F2EA90|nr:ATP-binding protein [Anaerococcus tetradius]
MKNLLEKSMVKIFSLILLLTFFINISISFREKIKAQNEFMRNSLGFLFYELKTRDIGILSDFEKAYPSYKLIYFDDDKNIIFRSKNELKIDKVKINNREKTQKIDYKLDDSLNTAYYIGGNNNLMIKSNNTILDFFDGRIISLYLLLYILIFGLIKFISSTMVDTYIKGLSRLDENYDFSSLDPAYEELRPYFKNLISSKKELRKEVDLYARNFKEIINITENMQEGLVICDEDGKIEIMNTAAKKYLDKESYLSFMDLIDDEQYKKSIEETLKSQKSRSLVLDVNNFNLKIFIDPIIDTKPRGFVLIILDNSETRKAELMRREFSANVSHELKSPLTSINGYAELIATGIAKKEDIRSFGKIIYKEGNRLLHIIDDILKLSRLDEDDKENDYVKLDIKDIVDSIIENYRKKSDDKNLEVTNKLTSFKIKTSLSLFTDLISNIYENAIKYTLEGGKIEISSILLDKKLTIFIKDTGVGISQKDIPRIFERFYVVDKARKRDQESTGLGLSIAKHIADHLGIKLALTSKLGLGTTFKIIINL